MSLIEATKLPSVDALTAEQLQMASDLAKRRMWVAVRRAVKDAGLSGADVARLLKLNRSTVSRLLASPQNLSIERASRILRAAGAYATVGYEAVEATALQEQVRAGTNADHFVITCNQPGNGWHLMLARNVPPAIPTKAQGDWGVAPSSSNPLKALLNV